MAWIVMVLGLPWLVVGLGLLRMRWKGKAVRQRGGWYGR